MSLTAPPAFRGRFTTREDAREAASRASGPYSILPAAVAVPADVDDLRVLVRWARGAGVALVPRGAATGMPGGNVGPGVAVELAPSFGEIGPVDVSRRRIRVGAGVVAGDVARRSGREGLFLPPLPSSSDRCTVGGMVANNSAGARTFGHGATRDWVRSLDVVLSDGRSVCVRSDETPDPFGDLSSRLQSRRGGVMDRWPAVRKNSSGYALDRFLVGGDAVQLLVGSEGTLGIVTAVTLELAPEPEARRLILLRAESPASLLEVVRAAGEVSADACELFGRRFIEAARLEDDPGVGATARGAYALVLVEVAGTGSEVEVATRRLGDRPGPPPLEATTGEERARLWEIRHAASPLVAAAAGRGLVSMQFIEDSVVPPEHLPDYLDGLDRILEEAETDAVVFGHAGDANVHVNPLVDVRDPDWRSRVRMILEATVDLVASLGGTLTGEHGDGRVRAPFLHRIWSPDAMDAFRAIKETLDPAGILNPGVILPLPGQDPLQGIDRAPSLDTAMPPPDGADVP